MTGDPNFLLSFHTSEGGTISFGDKKQGRIKATGSVQLTPDIQIRNVSLVDSLKFNLLSVAQICDQGRNEVTFTTTECMIKDSSREVIMKGKRVDNKYLFDHSFTPSKNLCLATNQE